MHLATGTPLIVVAIIAILASLALPMAVAVRSSAQATACLSNLRQFGMGFLAYPEDHEGRMPDWKWQEAVHPYLKASGRVAGYAAADRDLDFRMARCATAPTHTKAGLKLHVSYAYTGVYWRSFPAFIHFAWYNRAGNLSGHPVIMETQIQRPSEKVLLTEQWSDTGWTNWGEDTLNDQRLRQMHRGRSNVLCADGHVESIAVNAGGRWRSVQWFADPMFLPLDGRMSTRF